MTVARIILAGGFGITLLVLAFGMADSETTPHRHVSAPPPAPSNIVARLAAPGDNPECGSLGHWLVFSSDGVLLVTNGSTGWRVGEQGCAIRIWAKDGKLIRRFIGPETHYDWQRASVHISPDVKRLAAFSTSIKSQEHTEGKAKDQGPQETTTVIVWDMGSGKTIHERKWLNTRINSLAFSPDSKVLAISDSGRVGEPSDDWLIHLWDLNTNKARLTLHADRPKTDRHFAVSPFTPYFEVPVFSPNGKWLASTALTNTIHLWDVHTGKEVRQFRGHQTWIRQIAFSNDSKFLVSSCVDVINGFPLDWSIRVWDVETGRQLWLRKLDQKSEFAPMSVALSPDDRLLAICTPDADNTIRLWELATGTEVLRLHDKNRTRPYMAAFSPAGDRLASSMDKGSALLWRISPLGWQEPRDNRLNAQELLDCWTELANKDAAVAYRAIWDLSAAPADTLPFLSKRLRLVSQETANLLRKLVTDLSSDRFLVREGASKELARFGPEIEVPLSAALAQNPSLELQQRAKPLLKALDQWLIEDQKTLRSVRVIWVLERIGTSEAQKLLEILAAAAPGIRPIQHAEAALQRLAKRRVPVP